ncbi:hypothetical protein ACAF76_003785 [Brevibacillus sp. TJ4]|uniref:hypothetical protein n=1 Tax=Brevibacillus sp. TJ4 TaxID=3234853 RepID=UPI003BA1A51A
MKKWNQGVIAAALLLGTVLPGGVHAQDLSQPVALEQMSRDEGGGHLKFRQRISAHQTMYMTLLAEKYTPESVDEWKQVLKERDRLIEEMRAAKEASGEDREWMAKREERKKIREELRAKVEKGEITSDEMKQELEKWKEKNFPGKAGDDQARRAQMEQFRAVYEEFDGAIQSGDSAQIKAVMPKLLEQLKAKNERLAKRLKEVKK